MEEEHRVFKLNDVMSNLELKDIKNIFKTSYSGPYEGKTSPIAVEEIITKE